MSAKFTLDNFKGCILGGALGDALGWAVEFSKIDEIKEKYGSLGIQELDLFGEKVAEVSDDTQMLMFTIEGLLIAIANGYESDPVKSLFKAYLRWIYTQGYRKYKDTRGWVVNIPGINAQRAPGSTCLFSLRAGIMGTVDAPINNSKGAGAVMKVAPIGLIYNDVQEAFDIAVKSAALTHSHPTGYLAAGTFAAIISCLVAGESIEDAIDKAEIILKSYDNYAEVYNSLLKAVDFANSDLEADFCISELGEGWSAEEALALSIYCLLKNKDDFKAAVRMAVNIDGHSDTIGLMTGCLSGLILGYKKLPKDWLDVIEFRQELDILASDLFKKFEDSEEWMQKYPKIVKW